jgi:predicted acetyltransferase
VILEWLEQREKPDDPDSNSGFLSNVTEIYQAIKLKECLLFKSGRALIGFAVVEDNDDKVRQIDYFFIRVERRLQGMGRMAVEALAKDAKEAKMQRIKVRPVFPAWGFWRAMDFDYPADTTKEERVARDVAIEKDGFPGGYYSLFREL